jgi:hypothetical protein
MFMKKSHRFAAGAAATALLMSALAACTSPATEPAASSTVDVASAGEWMDGYLAAWEAKDADAVMALFSEDAVYQSVPGVDSETFVGREAIGDYWTSVTADQSEITTRRGTPVVTGNQATVEIWVTFANPNFNPDGDHIITLLEANVLTFDADGLVSKNVEYYNIQTGKVDPPAGWGEAE